MTVCRFCGERKPLVRSHIIPRAFYELPQRQVAMRIVSNVDGHRPQRSSMGVYDKNMLCAECDSYLGRFDQHAAEALLAKDAITPIACGNSIVGKRYDKADPEKIIRFVASVAWRASYCAHEFYGSVRLGRYQEIIGQFLKPEGQIPTEIGTIITEFNSEEVPLFNPRSTKIKEVRFWIIPAKRFMFYLKIDRQPMPHAMSHFSIRNGNPVVSLIRSWQGSNERRAAGNVARKIPSPFGA